MFCNNCGKKISFDDIRCNSCGEKTVFKALGTTASTFNKSISSGKSASISADRAANKSKFVINPKKLIPAVSVFAVVLVGLIVCFLLPGRDSDRNRTTADAGEVNGVSDFWKVILPENVSTSSKDSLTGNQDEGISSGGFAKDSLLNSDKWDTVLCSGDGYLIVEKTKSDGDKDVVLMGVYQNDGKCIAELSEDFILSGYLPDTEDGEKKYSSDNFKYLGDGVFVSSEYVRVKFPDKPLEAIGHRPKEFKSAKRVYLYNAKNGKSVDFNASYISQWDKGLLFFQNVEDPRCFSAINEEFIREELTDCNFNPNGEYNFPAYSEGVFFAKDKFYDLKGKYAGIDLSKYDICSSDGSEVCDSPYFKDGKCNFYAKDNNGVTSIVINRDDIERSDEDGLASPKPKLNEPEPITPEISTTKEYDNKDSDNEPRETDKSKQTDKSEGVEDDSEKNNIFKSFIQSGSED